MRKVKFIYNEKEYEGYYVGISPITTTTCLVVEDLEGKIYTIYERDVKFTSPPLNMAPVKRIDLKLLRNVLEGFKDLDKPETIERLIKLADERNIIIEDTEGYE